MTETEGARPLALVTGASGGIGAALARELARDGFDLLVTARRLAPLEALAADLSLLGARVRCTASDLARPGAAAELVAEVGPSPLEAVVLNAGAGYTVGFAEADEARQAAVLQLNVVAVTELARAWLPAMIARGRGRLMLVASLAAYIPGPRSAVYHATKAYVLSLGEALAHELRGTGVTATVLCPGPTRSGYWAGAGAASTRIGRGSLMRAEDVARIGYAALKRGRPVVVAGRQNALSAFAMPFLPRRMLLNMSANLNRSETE